MGRSRKIGLTSITSGDGSFLTPRWRELDKAVAKAERLLSVSESGPWLSMIDDRDFCEPYGPACRCAGEDNEPDPCGFKRPNH
jgi:hypothetical protein